METILQTVIGVLIAQKLGFVYQMWRVSNRYRAVEAYCRQVTLATRASQRLALYRQGQRTLNTANSTIVAWHILVSTPSEAEATIRMHCDYIFRNEAQMSALVMEAGCSTEGQTTQIKHLYETNGFATAAGCGMLYETLRKLGGRMRDVKAFHEREYSRITGENILTTVISRWFS